MQVQFQQHSLSGLDSPFFVGQSVKLRVGTKFEVSFLKMCLVFHSVIKQTCSLRFRSRHGNRGCNYLHAGFSVACARSASACIRIAILAFFAFVRAVAGRRLHSRRAAAGAAALLVALVGHGLFARCTIGSHAVLACQPADAARAASREIQSAADALRFGCARSTVGRILISWQLLSMFT